MQRSSPRELCEFPGGDYKLYEWLSVNIHVPEDFKGFKKIIVQFFIKSDGTVTDPEILRPSKNEAANNEAIRLVNSLPKFLVKYRVPEETRFLFTYPVTFKEISDAQASFKKDFPKIEAQIRRLYEVFVFRTSQDPDFKLSDFCTDEFIHRMESANNSDPNLYLKWFLRPDIKDNPTGEDDVIIILESRAFKSKPTDIDNKSTNINDNTLSKVTHVVSGIHTTAVVSWEYKGQRGCSSFPMIKSDGIWKINDNTEPEY